MNDGWQQRLVEAREYLLSDHTVIPTGYQSLDEVLRGGPAVGQLSMLLGRVGVGKSLIACNIAVNAVLEGHPVGYASLEMMGPEIVVRCLSILLNLSVEEVFALLRSNVPEPKLIDAQKTLKDMYIWDEARPTWEQLYEWVSEFSPDLVVIDHLSLMGRDKYQRGGEVERIRQLAEDAKKFAKDTQTSVLILHQVGRSTEAANGAKNHGNSPLSMEDALYAGEADCDIVLGVFRPVLDPAVRGTGRAKIIEQDVFLQLLKHRAGKTIPEGIKLHWNKGSLRVEEPT